jgi:hypothetical protein
MIYTGIGHQQQATHVGGGEMIGGSGGPRPAARRVIGQEVLHHMGGADPRQPIRPQLRPQRSLDNRLPSTQAQQELSTHQSMDPMGNIYATNNNVNTQSVAHPGLGPMDSQDMSSTSAMIPTATSIHSIPHGQQHSDQYQQLHQQQGMFGAQQVPVQDALLSHDPLQRSIQQSQQQACSPFSFSLFEYSYK